MEPLVCQRQEKVQALMRNDDFWGSDAFRLEASQDTELRSQKKRQKKNDTKTNKPSPLTISPAKLDTPEPSSDWVTQRYRSWSWLVTSLRLKEAAKRLWLMFFIRATGMSSPFLLLMTDKQQEGQREAPQKMLEGEPAHTHKNSHTHTQSLAISLTAGLKVVTTIEP